MHEIVIMLVVLSVLFCDLFEKKKKNESTGTRSILERYTAFKPNSTVIHYSGLKAGRMIEVGSWTVASASAFSVETKWARKSKKV